MLGAHIIPRNQERQINDLAGQPLTFDGRNQAGLGAQPGTDKSRLLSGAGRLKFKPQDYTGRGNYGPPRQPGNMAAFTPKLKDAPTTLMKGGHAERSETYDKAVDMVAEGRFSPISQIRILQRVSRDIRPIHGFSRKLYARQFTQPLQDIIGPFKKNRQQALPGSSQVSIAPHPQTAQPSIRRAGPQTNIPTGMPFNSPMVI